MPRIPYQPKDLVEPADVVSAVRARRGGQLSELDRMLLHSPAFTLGWNSHLGATRTGLTVNGRLRELAICAIAILNDAPFEWMQHAPVFLKEGGSQAQLDAVQSFSVTGKFDGPFDATERAVLQLTLEMTRNVKVSDAAFAAAKAAFANHQQLVEMVGVIATYNMVSRFLVALGVEAEK